jgi:DNA-binding response OmpR family regulator
MYILIAEDEASLAEETFAFLTGNGYQCDVAATGRSASEKLFVNNYDFVLLDLGLPDMDGLDLIHEIKNQDKDTSVIIITARGAVDDRVKGLLEGADDYLAKPFSLSELLARMIAITRRKHGLKSNVISFQGFLVDFPNRSLVWEAQSVNLTKKEFDILNYLIMNKNRVITRMQLTEHIWGDIIETDNDSNYIDVHLKNIRKKLSKFSETEWLETIRGIGYKVSG